MTIQQLGMLQRVRTWAKVFGQFFDGKRDLYKVFGYRHSITTGDLLFKYQRQDLAARVVEAEPRALWADPPKPVGDEAFFSVWQNVQSRTDLFHHIYRLDNLIGMYQYGILLLGFDDGRRLEVPLSEGSARNLNFVQPHSETSVRIEEYEQDPTSPFFLMPKFYRITSEEVISGGRKVLNVQDQLVHASRVIHVVENPLENSVFGNPRLVRVFNLLDDLLKVGGGSAETYWLRSSRGIQADVDKDMNLTPEDEQNLSDEIEEWQHELRRFIRTRGVKIEDLGGDVADPKGTFSVIVGLISAASGIPQRILLGAEAGQLSSAQDRANWANRIDERRNLFAEPTILNPLVRRLVFAGVLPVPTQLTWRWSDAFKLSPLERAQTSAQRARAVANLTKALKEDAPDWIDGDDARRILGMDEPEPIFNDPGDVVVNMQGLMRSSRDG